MNEILYFLKYFFKVRSNIYFEIMSFVRGTLMVPEYLVRIRQITVNKRRHQGSLQCPDRITLKNRSSVHLKLGHTDISQQIKYNWFILSFQKKVCFIRNEEVLETRYICTVLSFLTMHELHYYIDNLI